MPFPLFNLPFLALKQVFRTMDPQEILITSFCSKRTKSAIIYSFRKSNYEVGIAFVTGLKIYIQTQQFQVSLYPVAKEFEVAFYPDHARIYHRSCNEAFITGLINHIVEVFNKPKVSLQFTNGIRDPFAVELMEFVKGLGVEVPKIIYELPYSSPESYKRILDLCPTNGSLVMKTELPRYFEYKAKTPLRLDHFEIGVSCHWIIMCDLMECKSIKIIGTTRMIIPSKVLNHVFKRIADSECRLERIEAWCGNKLDYRELLEMVNGLKGVEIKNEYCAEFRRANGQKMRISFGDSALLLEPVNNE